MDFQVEDLVISTVYGESIIYRIKCFIDRPGQACDLCEDMEPSPCPDDVHLEVVWKKHKALAPDWDIGAYVVAGYKTISEPGNAMLVLALEAA